MSFPIRRLPSLITKWHSVPVYRLSSSPRRCYSTPKPGVDLPETSAEWSKLFKVAALVNHRISVRNPETAAMLAEAFVPEGSKDKVIIEAYPGPGQLTRALLNLPKDRFSKLIILENWEPYLQWLRPLKEVDPRVEIVEMNPFLWDTYSHLTETGMLDSVQKHEWDQGVHQQLQFISHLPSTVHSEQLLSQFLRSMPERNWLFAYGRVPLSFIISDYLYKRVVATAEDLARCKLSIVAEATATCSPTLDLSATQPYNLHFHPLPSSATSGRGTAPELKTDNRSIGRPFRTMTVVPFEKPFVSKGQMEAWDYCLRRLFVKKSTALNKTINLLAPNAQILLPAVTDPKLPASERLDVTKKIKNMNARDWSILVKAFEEWPFKPTDLTMNESFAGSIRSL